MFARFATLIGIGFCVLSLTPVWAGRGANHASTTPNQPPRPGNQTNPASGVGIQKESPAIPKEALLPMAVPFVPWHGIPVIQTQVNGNHQERFAVTTGLNANTISTEAYARLELQASTREFLVHILDSKTQGTEARIQSLQINSLKIADLGAVMTDVFALLSPRPHPDAPTGWLGTPFLSGFQVTFDFSRNTIFLHQPKAPLPNEKGAVTVPLIQRDGRLLVKVSLPRAKSFDAIIDTGTITTLIPTEVAEKLGINPVQIFPLTKGSGVEARAGLIVLPKLNIGKLEATDVRAIFLAADAPPAFDKNLAVLGTDFLKHYKVTISFDKKKVVFIPLAMPGEGNEDTPEPP